jgi:hypothetical protein
MQNIKLNSLLQLATPHLPLALINIKQGTHLQNKLQHIHIGIAGCIGF